MSKRDVTAAVLQSAGILSAAAAGWMVTAALGLLVLGVALIVVGVAVERDR